MDTSQNVIGNDYNMKNVFYSLCDLHDTGKISWGIAYYVNGELIPELTLKRGETYTFIIRTGNDPNNSAEYHPVYLSTDEIGGFAQRTEREKRVTIKEID